jgi:mono/diheme cytochrome c family protein
MRYHALLVAAACGPNYERILALEGNPTEGQILYEEHCASCHGVDGGGVSGPALTERVPGLTGTEILQTIDEGPANMPDFSGTFSDQDLADILEYVTLTFQ